MSVGFAWNATIFMIRLKETQKTELPAERHGKMCLIHGDVQSAKYLR